MSDNKAKKVENINSHPFLHHVVMISYQTKVKFASAFEEKLSSFLTKSRLFERRKEILFQLCFYIYGVHSENKELTTILSSLTQGTTMIPLFQKR